MLDNGIIFDARIAEKYSLEEAIVIHKIYGWIKHNAVNGKNYHDGRYWTFNSLSAFAKYFPFWSESKVKRILIDLYGGSDKKEIEPKHEQLLLKGNFNKSAFDRTVWYSFTDDFFNFLSSLGYTLCADIPQEDNPLSESDQMDIPQAETRFSEYDQMDIPQADKQYQHNNTNNNTNKNKKDKSFLQKTENKQYFEVLLSLGIDEQVAEEFMVLRKQKKATNSPRSSEIAKRAILEVSEQLSITTTNVIEICLARGWYGCQTSYFKNIVLSDYGIEPKKEGLKQDCRTEEAYSPWGVQYQ